MSHSARNDVDAALAYLVSMAQGHDYADERKISDAEDELLLALDAQWRLIAEDRAEALEEAARDWPASGMTRTEAQAWLQGRATRERTRVIPPGTSAGA